MATANLDSNGYFTVVIRCRTDEEAFKHLEGLARIAKEYRAVISPRISSTDPTTIRTPFKTRYDSRDFYHSALDIMDIASGEIIPPREKQ